MSAHGLSGPLSRLRQRLARIEARTRPPVTLARGLWVEGPLTDAELAAAVQAHRERHGGFTGRVAVVESRKRLTPMEWAEKYDPAPTIEGTADMRELPAP